MPRKAQPVLHAHMGASKDKMKLQLQAGDSDLTSMRPTSPDCWPLYMVNPRFRNVTTSVARQNGNGSYMAGTDGLGWNNSNATVPPAMDPTNFNTDISDGDYQSQTFNLSWNMLNGQAVPKNQGSDLINWASPCLPPFDGQLPALSASGHVTGSGMPPVENGPLLLNKEQKAQRTQYRLRGRGKDRKGGIFPCQECEMTFRGSYELKRHLNQTNKHGGRKFKCTRCGDLLSRQDGLDKHKSNPRACRVK